MKRSLVMLSLYSFLFAGCTLTIGDGCKCGENGCGKSTQIQIIEKEPQVEETSDLPSDEYIIEEETLFNR